MIEDFTDSSIGFGMELAAERGDIVSWGFGIDGVAKVTTFTVWVPGQSYEFSQREAHAFLAGIMTARKAVHQRR